MSHGNNQREKDLAAQNAALQAAAQKQIAQNVQTPLEKALSDKAMKWIDFTSGKNGPVDYTKAPGLVYTNMFTPALQNRYKERTALGGMQMGKESANPTALALREAQMGDEMAEAQGENMVQAVNAENANETGNVMPFLIGANATRQGQNLNATTGMANTATDAYSRVEHQLPWWQTALTAGLGAAGNVFKYTIPS